MVVFLFSAAILAPASQVSTGTRCRTVSGTYAIYANHDLLHIDGSHHFVEVISATLDAKLERHGWDNTVARDRFTICGSGIADLQKLTIRNDVELRGWDAIHFEPRNPAHR